jgi:hypothetical protein
VSKGRPLNTPEDVAAYETRTADPETGRLTYSEYDRDKMARGYRPVVMDDGTIGYFTSADGYIPTDNGMEYAWADVPGSDPAASRGAVGRAGRRMDLEKATVPGSTDNRYEIATMTSPTGETVQAWRPSQAGKDFTKSQRTQQMRATLADRAGLSAAEAAGLTDDQLREQARATRTNERKAREEAWRAQMMLGGGQPTGGPRGTKALANAIMMLPEDQRASSMRYMLPGGERAAAVEAANAATAGKLAHSAMTAFLTNNPMATPEQRAMFEQRAREANPAAAGAQDIASGKPETPEAQAELGRLAESMDTGTFGVNTGDSSSMAEALMKPPYNLRRPEAEELAYRYMNRRSRFGIGRPGADGSTPPTGVGPTPNPINPRVPLAAPSRPPGV